MAMCCPGWNHCAATLASRGSSDIWFNHQPLDPGVKSFASRTKARTKTYIYLSPETLGLQNGFGLFFKEMLMDILFSLSYSDTKQNKELETKSH
jgi:hypothetical protein